MSRLGDNAGAVDGRLPPEASEQQVPRPLRSASEALLMQLVAGMNALVAEQKRTNELLSGFAKARAQQRTAPTATPAARTGGGGEVASARDLDGPNGDPTVKKNPPRWQGGGDFAGYKFSECPPEFLECLADFKDWQADNPKADADPKYARYARLDASRARGWAERNRKSGGAPARPPASDEGDMIP